jgi:hypothetical protein
MVEAVDKDHRDAASSSRLSGRINQLRAESLLEQIDIGEGRPCPAVSETSLLECQDEIVKER